MDQNEVGEAVLGGLGEDEAQALDEGIAALDAETRYSIVVGQMDPEPSLQINGDDIRFVFDGGTVGDSFMDCTFAGVLREAGETVTVVYPDGEAVC